MCLWATVKVSDKLEPIWTENGYGLFVLQEQSSKRSAWDSAARSSRFALPSAADGIAVCVEANKS